MNAPSSLVTVGLPVYNGEAYLDLAIRSVLRQTEDDFRLILSDNHSSDATPDICAEFAAKDPRITFIRQEANIGVMGNFEFVLREATSPLFVWIAHDHVLESRFLEESIRLMRSSPGVIGAGCQVNGIASDDTYLWTWSADQGMGAPRVKQRASAALRGHSHLAFYGLFDRRALLEVVGPDFIPAITALDDALAFRVALKGRFLTSQQTLFTMRMLGYEVFLGEDNRLHQVKELSESGRVYTRRRDERFRLSLADLLAAPVPPRAKAEIRVRIWLAWAQHVRLRTAEPSPLRIAQAVRANHYASAIGVGLFWMALAPISATRWVGRHLTREAYRLRSPSGPGSERG